MKKKLIITESQYKKLVENINEGMDYSEKHETLFQIFSKYVKNPDDVEKLINLYLESGYQILPDYLKANLNRDMDWISFGQMEHDNKIQSLESN